MRSLPIVRVVPRQPAYRSAPCTTAVTGMTRMSGIFKALTSTFSVELPGIETEHLPGKMHVALLFRYVSFPFVPAR